MLLLYERWRSRGLSCSHVILLVQFFLCVMIKTRIANVTNQSTVTLIICTPFHPPFLFPPSFPPSHLSQGRKSFHLRPYLTLFLTPSFTPPPSSLLSFISLIHDHFIHFTLNLPLSTPHPTIYLLLSSAFIHLPLFSTSLHRPFAVPSFISSHTLPLVLHTSPSLYLPALPSPLLQSSNALLFPQATYSS